MKNKSNNNSLLNWLNIRNMDFLGSEFQLKYTSNGRYQTKLGGLISCLVGAFMGAVMYSSLTNLNRTDSPATSFSRVYSENAPKLSLLKENIFFHFGLRTGNKAYKNKQELAEINRFITIKGFIKTRKMNPSTGIFHPEYLLDLNYKPCDLVKEKSVLDNLPLNQLSRKLLENYLFCPELEGAQEKYVVESKPGSAPTKDLLIYIFPCSLPDSRNCADLSEFTQADLLHTKIKKLVDPSNFEEPITTILEFGGAQKIDPSLSKTLYYTARENEVWDDSYDFFDKKLKMRSADFFMEDRDFRSRDSSQLHCDASTLDNAFQRGCQPYIVMRLVSSGEKRVIVRTYSKFFMILGEIGGTAELVILFAALVYSGYNWFFLSKYIKNEVFELREATTFFQKATQIHRSKRPKLKRKLKPSKRNKVSNNRNDDRQISGRFKTNFSQTEERNTVNGSLCHSQKTASTFQSSLFKNSQNSNFTLKILDRVEKLLNRQIAENFSGISLFKKLNELKVITDIFLKPRHLKLLPVVLLTKMDKESIKEAEIQQNKKKSTKRGSEANLRTRLRTRHTEPRKNTKTTKKPESDNLNDAYNKILENKPNSNLIERVVDDYFIERISSYLNRHQNDQNLPQENHPSSSCSQDNPSCLSERSDLCRIHTTSLSEQFSPRLIRSSRLPRNQVGQDQRPARRETRRRKTPNTPFYEKSKFLAFLMDEKSSVCEKKRSRIKIRPCHHQDELEDSRLVNLYKR